MLERKIGIIICILGCLILIQIMDDGVANQAESDENYISIGMTMESFQKLKCDSFKTIDKPTKQYESNDKRLRKYYQFKPKISVVMRESELKSYYEFIFDSGKLVEINRYSDEGMLIESLDKMYCF
ncbi:MAG: hypothetical protein ACXU93_14240 [Thermodesulfobacteriota bacterium]